MRTEEELNKLIAEFVGFKPQSATPQRPLVMAWIHPDGHELTKPLPNFLDPDWGIALLFKWAVPKCLKKFGSVKLYISALDGVCMADIGLGRTCRLDKNPALALARALEKLIDGGQDGN